MNTTNRWSTPSLCRLPAPLRGFARPWKTGCGVAVAFAVLVASSPAARLAEAGHPVVQPVYPVVTHISSESVCCDDVSGVWRGRWCSHPTGHRGPVNATIRRINPDCYEATFHGRFFVLIPFVYRATLHRVPGTDLFHSTKRMPIVGTYQMTAQISGGHFEANFTSGKDSGIFRMTRVR